MTARAVIILTRMTVENCIVNRPRLKSQMKQLQLHKQHRVLQVTPIAHSYWTTLL